MHPMELLLRVVRHFQFHTQKYRMSPPIRNLNLVMVVAELCIDKECLHECLALPVFEKIISTDRKIDSAENARTVLARELGVRSFEF